MTDTRFCDVSHFRHIRKVDLKRQTTATLSAAIPFRLLKGIEFMSRSYSMYTRIMG